MMIITIIILLLLIILYHRIGHDRIWQTGCQKLYATISISLTVPFMLESFVGFEGKQNQHANLCLEVDVELENPFAEAQSVVGLFLWSFSASRCTLVTDVIVWSWPLHPAKLCQQDAEFSVALRECTCCDAEKHPVETPVPLDSMHLKHESTLGTPCKFPKEKTLSWFPIQTQFLKTGLV